MATFILIAKEGKLSSGTEFNKNRLIEELRQNEGKQYRLEKIKAKRSMLQNNLYWHYLGVIEQETGNESTDLHSYFRDKFIPPKFVRIKGKEHRVSGSTTRLNKVQFGEYMEKICAETGVPIPDPKLVGYL
ncbi:MAG: hypothetical protein RLZZ546_2161 [Bacteroidota bacterium]|jgi:hypothetical protein